MIQKKENPMWWKSLLLAGTLLGTLSACSGGGGGGGGGIPDPTPDPDPTPGVTTGQVSFVPDLGGLPASSGFRFHLYPASGAAVTKDCDASGFSGTLEAGAYRVLAYNTDATGVTFENTDSYDKAAVRVRTSETPTRASSLIGLPSKVYVLTVNNLTVEKGGTVNQKPAVSNLVKPLALRFSIDDGSVISSIRGSLNGFYPSVLLTTGAPDEASLAASPQTGMAFGIPVSGNIGSFDIGSLGMLDPKDGTAYRSLLVLDIAGTDGRSTQTEVDLSGVLTKILAENGGALPGGTTAEIEIQLEMLSDLDMAFKATISHWVPGGNVAVDL